MAEIALVTDKLLPVAHETFADNLSAGIASEAVTVPINSLAEYDEGDSVVLTVDPGTADQATFIGTVQGNDVIDCQWTEGNIAASHSTGAVVIDYISATHYDVVTKAVRAHTNDDGTLKTTAVQAALNISGSVTPDWTALATTPTVVSSDGQKQYKIRYTGVNYTDRLQDGTKLKLPRTGTTPTTSMAFAAASSQYASKASPTGITFTDDFTCEAWVYVNASTGASQGIVNRYNGSSGWFVFMEDDGRLNISGRNAGNFRKWTTYQSVPTGRWVHLAATHDMSGGTSATNKIFFDGVEVSAVLSSTGTPSALVQAGDLQVGASNSGTFFNGEIANVRVWSTIRTAAQIRDNKDQETPADTTGLVAHFKGNGSWNDSSTNANHLTAVAGAINNFASHPYSATEHAIATKVEYTASNTDVTIFTGDGCLPNETLGATSYSTARAPFGFPAGENSWGVDVLKVGDTLAAGTAGWGVIAGTPNLVVPIGKWRIGYSCNARASRTGSTGAAAWCSLSTSTTEVGGPRLSARAVVDGASGGITAETPVYREAPVVVSTPTQYNLVHKVSGSGTATTSCGFTESITLFAECAYI